METKTIEMINFENMFTSVQVCSEYSGIFKEYLEKTFESLVKRMEGESRKISKTVFSTYVELPLIVANKIFKEFDKDLDGYLCQVEFTQGMFDLYFGSYEKLLELTFNLMKFVEGGVIFREDAKLLMVYLNSQLGIFSDIEIYLNEFFGNKQELSYEEYKNIISSSSPNLFLVILLFLYKNQPFTEEGLKYFKEHFCRNTNSGAKSKFSCANLIKISNDIAKPSAEILRVMKYNFKPFDHVRRKKSKKNVLVYEYIKSEESDDEDFYIPPSADDNNMIIEDEEEVGDNTDIFELNENNNNNKLKKFNNPLKINRKDLIIFTSNNKHPFKKQNLLSGSINSLNSQDMNKNISHSVHFSLSGLSHSSFHSRETNNSEINNININPETTFENLKLNLNNQIEFVDKYNSSNSIENFPPNSSHFDIEIHKLTKENKLIKQKMVIIEKDVFLFRFSVSRNIFVLDSIFSLCGIYITSCVEMNLLDKIFYPLAMLNSYGNTLAHLSNIFFFKKKEDLEKTLEFLKVNLNIKNIQEDYEMKQNLGKGQFGKVKLGVNKKSGEKVAIKIIEKKRLKGEELELVKTEIDVMKFLKNCPNVNIVKPIDFYEDKDNIFMVMECLSGGTLNNYLVSKGEVMKEKFTKQLCKQIANGICFLHKNGIIHRDIKPENIMLVNSTDAVPTLRITDFGLSKVMAKNEKTKEGFGTLVYTAPEILYRRTYDYKVDVWSLGVLIFYINSGLLPFDGPNLNLQQIAEMICHEELAFDSSLHFSHDLKALIKSCLIKSPLNRLDINAVLKTEWFNNLS